ncbi:hypothetical protein E3P99_00609 [Wallemia hederae]|uniref:RING-type domain-containing protein n=1 Tax=Wallemia hederae TaxID=1540922 RepID=A0A4T0FVX1_9BASI|nr:hypothetical protein E3P99_00609 [Wallemia hederae]
MFKVRWNRKKSEQGTPSSPITPLHPVNDNLESPARASFSDGLHPYSQNQPSPSPISPVSPSANAILADQEEDYENCPVCLEPLSFSFRLPGEKPHIVPLCGHALHDQCFTQVYGPLPSAKMPSKSLGVCGICRKPMKLSDEAETQGTKKTNKLDKLAGIASPPLGRDLHSSQSNYSLNNTYASQQKAPLSANSIGNLHSNYSQLSPLDSPSDPLDSSADDAIPAAPSNSSNTSISNNSKSSYSELVSPNISINTEFKAAIRPHMDQKSSITAIVTVGIPSRHLDPEHAKESSHPSLIRYQERQNALYDSETFSPLKRSDSRMSADNASISSTPSTFSVQPQNAHKQHPQQAQQGQQPLKSVATDLYSRILDWKGNNPHSFGSLVLYSLSLTIRRSTQSQTAQVFLFENALICVSEDRKSAPLRDGRKALKLKGKIYIFNIRRVVPMGDTALVLETEAEDFRDLTLMFMMRDEREHWKAHFDKLIFSSVNIQHQGIQGEQQQQQQQQPDSPTMSLQEKLDKDRSSRLLSPQAGSNRQSSQITQSPQQLSMASPTQFGGPPLSPISLPHSPRSTAPSSYGRASSIATSGVSSNPSDVSAFGLAYAGAGDNRPRDSFRSSSSAQFPNNPPAVFTEQSLAPLAPHDGTLYPHAPADVVLILPLPTSQHGSPTLKLRFLKSSLEFVINKLGPRDRICIVTFRSIQGGALRRTPFITPSSILGKQKLSRFLETFGTNWEDSVYGIDGAPDPFKVGTKDDEKTDVVTAMNAALDGVLQRTAKNSVTGIFLVSDNQDPTRRAQMELVLARAEAASVPIHTLGWSRVHDPSSLWLLSSHTGGTYTFVKEWNQLRDCIAGAIGGLFSVAATNMKLHINVLDWPMVRVRKVSPSTSTIVSSDGNEVHVELGEIHYGEQRELLVEMDLIHPAKATIGTSGQNTKRLSRYSTQANVNSNIQDGLAGLSVGETMADAYDDMIDEAALFEVDASYHDPNVGRSVSRLVQPVLLTMTIHPNIQADAHSTIGSSLNITSQRLNAILGSPDASVIRRRMELLSSDMITRALILISRKNNGQAQRLLTETVRLVRMAIANLINSTVFSPNANSPSMSISPSRFKKDHSILSTADTLEAILFELEGLLDGLEEHKENFEREQRNLGAQQAMILRDQKSWTGRSPIERLFWNFDNSRGLLVKSLEWNR